jgi:UDP-N-acetylglucosamine acyltransferase
MVHPTAIVHPDANLHPTVRVGPYAVIDGGVELGAGCVVGPHVYITGLATIGPNNRFHAGCVIGGAPQDLKYKDEPTRLRIGAGNEFREHVTVHRSNKVTEDTVIGSNCLFMASSHVGHNSVVGNHVILVNAALLGGHAVVEDRALLSGNSAVHQFCRVGTLALLQGGSIVTQDLPPYCVNRRVNELCGLNVIGMRRAGISEADRLELKQLYRFLFREGRALRGALAEAGTRFQSVVARTLIEFAQGSKRGLCSEEARGHEQDDE